MHVMDGCMARDVCELGTVFLQVVIGNDYWRVQRRLLQVNPEWPCLLSRLNPITELVVLKVFLWHCSPFLRRFVMPSWLAWSSAVVWTL